MKVRSLKQALHWLFLAVGALAAAALLVSASTYLDYAREGYGLEVSIDDAELKGMTLYLTISVDNPGRFYMQIYGTGTVAWSNGSASYPIAWGADVIEKMKNSGVISLRLDAEDADILARERMVIIDFDFTIKVPERDAMTRLPFAAANVGVRA